MQESWQYQAFRAMERMGPKAFFVFAALDIGGYARPLEAIVSRARPATGYLDNGEVVQIAEQIDGTEDTTLTDWLARWEWDLPPWFRREALQVMLMVTVPMANPQIHVPFDPFIHGGVFPETQSKAAARAALTAAFKKHLDAYLDTAYAEYAKYAEAQRKIERAQRTYRPYPWAVRFQFLRESPEAIGKSVGLRRQSVDQAVKRVLRDVGLTPRTERLETRLPAGRKPKSRNTQVSK